MRHTLHDAHTTRRTHCTAHTLHDAHTTRRTHYTSHTLLPHCMAAILLRGNTTDRTCCKSLAYILPLTKYIFHSLTNQVSRLYFPIQCWTQGTISGQVHFLCYWKTDISISYSIQKTMFLVNGHAYTHSYRYQL